MVTEGLPSASQVRILYVISTLDAGGAQRGLVNLVNNLDQDRFDVTICCLNRGGVLSQDLRPEIKLHILHKRRGLGNLVAVVRLFRLIRLNHYHIVHTHLLIPNLLGRAAALLARPPVIIAAEHGITPHKPRFYILLDWLLGELTDRVTAVSQAVARVRVQREGIPPEKLVIIPNPVDLDDFGHQAAPEALARLRLELGLSLGTLYIGIVARLTPIKGLDTFIDACSQVAREVPEARFLIVGDGELKASLQKRATELGLDSQLRFLTNRTDVPQILNLCDVCVLTSLSESCPLAVLEYMAAQKPVIATNVGGIPEFVLDQETGILVPPSDPGALAREMITLLQNAELRARLGAAGRLWVQRFSAQEIARRYQNLYWELLEEKEIYLS
jgi:glycosyltransferase involved in cell wall biosynthesis